jgi:uncharacterized Zn finger protein
MERLKRNRYNSITRDVEIVGNQIYVDIKNDGYMRYGKTNKGDGFVDLDGGPFLAVGDVLTVEGEEVKMEKFEIKQEKLIIHTNKKLK